MQKTFFCLLFGLAVAAAGYSADSFSRSLSAQDFRAAGLQKLTPDELRRLDVLAGTFLARVGSDQNSAPPAKLTEFQSSTAPQSTDDKTERQQTADSSHRLQEQGKVVLTPGTEVVYRSLDSTLTGPFTGWEKGTVFTLANGQHWQVLEGSYAAGKHSPGTPVRLEPGALGGFFLRIEGGGRPKVKLVSRPPNSSELR